MTYFFKHIVPWQVIITIIYLIYMFINNDFYKFLMAAIPAVFLMLKIYYDKSKYVFIFYRKLVAYISNPTVYWESSTYYTLVENIDFDYIIRLYVQSLRENNYKLKNLDFREFGFNGKIDGTEIQVTYDKNYSQINFLYSSKISYKDSINEFNDKFYKLLEILKNTTANRNDDFLYRVDLEFENFNPFYSLYVKNYADLEVIDFNLEYKVRDLDFEVLKKSMVIKSKNRNSISTALKNYLIVSN